MHLREARGLRTALVIASALLSVEAYLGGSDWGYGSSIGVDSSGNAYLSGGTFSLDFPVTANAFDTSFNGMTGYGDAFVAKMPLGTNASPIGDAGPDQQAYRNTLVVLNGSNSYDPDGDGISFGWMQTSGPPTSLIGANSSVAAFVPTQLGNYTFRLSVSDGGEAWANAQGAPYNTSSPGIAMNPKGDAFLMWYLPDTNWVGPSSVDVANYTAESGWGTVQGLAGESSDFETSAGFGVAVDHVGNAVALYMGPCTSPESPQCWYGGTNYAVGQGWGADGVGCSLSTEWGWTDVVVGSAGHAYLSGVCGDYLYAPGVGWSGISPNPYLGNASGLPIKVDSTGGAVAMWDEWFGQVWNGTWANHYVPGVGWNTPELVDPPNPNATGFWDVALYSPGSDLLVWGEYDGIWAKHYNPTTGWGPRERVGAYALGGNTSVSGHVAVDASGNAAFVWAEWNGSLEAVGVSSYIPEIGWGVPEHSILNDSFNVNGVAVDPSGLTVATGTMTDGIWASGHVPGLGWGAPRRYGTMSGSGDPSNVAMDSSGNATVLWWQPDGWRANQFRLSFSSDTVTVTVVNRAPVANAGQDQTVDQRGVSVYLNGLGSYDDDAESLTYEWVQTAGPDNSTINNAAAAVADFVPAGIGTYTFELTVRDPHGALAADTVNVIATLPDAPPSAVATSSPAIGFIGTPITFDATGSTDDVGIADYLWDFGDGTTNANAVAAHAYSVRGVFPVTLTVRDTAGQSDTDGLVIRIENRAPVATATATPPPIYRGVVVVLDAAGSSDPDGDSLTYMWRQTGGPPVTLSAVDAAVATFVPSQLGTYVFNVTVGDGFGGSAEASVTVTPLNWNPDANAGPDQPSAAKRVPIALDATGSSDPDGDVLMYLWTPPPGITVSDVNSATPTFTATRSGAYTFFLRVDDSFGGTSSDAVVVTVANTTPLAVVNAPATSAKRSSVTLNGAASLDPDGDPLTYAWEQASGPNVTIRSPNGAIADFTPMLSGTYVFSLTVDDGDVGGAASAQVVVTIPNSSPFANAGSDLSSRKNLRVVLVGSALDMDGDAVTVDWSQVSVPAPITLYNTTTLRPDFVAGTVGTYLIRIDVRDEEGATSSDLVAVVVWSLPPTAAMTANPIAVEGVPISFDASASADPDGTVVGYLFDFGDGTPAAGGPSHSQAHAFASAGSYLVSVVVTDDDGNMSAPAAVQVVVTRPDSNRPPIAVILVTPATGDNQTLFQFDGYASTDDGLIVSYRWEFGEGTTATGALVSHRFPRDGKFTVTLTVTDDGGLEANTSASVTVLTPAEPPRPREGFEDTTIVGGVVVVGIIIAVLWQFRFFWFPPYILWCYTKLRRDEILDNFARGEIYGFIKLNPGESYSDIKRSLGLAAGPLTYHLAVLEREGLIRSVADRARKLFYPSDAAVPKGDGDLRAMQVRLLEVVTEEPGMAVNDLALYLGVNRHVALYHIRKLVREDLVRLERRMARLRAYPIRGAPPVGAPR